MAEINKRQAYVVDGAEVLPNPNGTAVGEWIALDDKAGKVGKVVVMVEAQPPPVPAREYGAAGPGGPQKG